MSKRRLLARIVVYVLSVALVFGVSPLGVVSSAASGNPSATISPQNHVFPPAVVGYGEQAARVFTITNTGDVNLYLFGAAWTGNFRVDSGYDIALIKPGESPTFNLRPNPNLPVGTHTGEYTGWFLPPLDSNERHRIVEAADRLHRSAIANYLGIASETVYAWSSTEWDAFLSEHDADFRNSPEHMRWVEEDDVFWRSAGRIELRAAFSFTVNRNLNPPTGR